MAGNKTIPTGASVQAFVDGIADVRRREEAGSLLTLMAEATGLEPAIWGPSMIGYGRYAYRYGSGRSGESFLTGFSPRKPALAIYIMPGFDGYADRLAKLGPHTHSVSCLYIKKLAAVDLAVLRDIVADSVRVMRQRYPVTG